MGSPILSCQVPRAAAVPKCLLLYPLESGQLSAAPDISSLLSPGMPPYTPPHFSTAWSSLKVLGSIHLASDQWMLMLGQLWDWAGANCCRCDLWHIIVYTCGRLVQTLQIWILKGVVTWQVQLFSLSFCSYAVLQQVALTPFSLILLWFL